MLVRFLKAIWKYYGKARNIVYTYDFTLRLQFYNHFLLTRYERSFATQKSRLYHESTMFVIYTPPDLTFEDLLESLINIAECFGVKFNVFGYDFTVLCR